MYELSTNYEKMFDNTTKKLSDYIISSGVKSLVLGVSGGIDSALVAALARHAIDKSGTGIPLIGRSIVIETNKEDEISRADSIGGYFCDDFEEIDLTNLFFDNLTELDLGDMDEDSYAGKIAKGNIKARIRMIQLYHLAGVTGGMVLGTDNYTELLMGFWTLNGDVGDYGMVQNLWKTEVYGLSSYIVDMYRRLNCHFRAMSLNDCIDATPTDGLGITNSDLDQLGADSYEEVDQIMIGYLNLPDDCKLMVTHPVITRYNATHFKRENPYNIPREDIV